MSITIEEYKALEEEMRDTLEAQYNMFMLNNEVISAYETLGRLMAYKLIDLDDARVEPNNKSVFKFGIDKKHRFELDYRRDTNYIPEWLFGTLGKRKTFQIKTMRHRGYRRELGYIGYTEFPSHPLSFRVSLCKTTVEAKNAVERLCKDYKESTGRTMQTEPLNTMAQLGVCRIYKVSCESACISAFKEVGTVLVTAEDDGVHIKVMPNYDSIIGLWVPVAEMCLAMASVTKNLVETRTGNTPVSNMSAIVPYEKAQAKQREVYNEAEKLGMDVPCADEVKQGK